MYKKLIYGLLTILIYGCNDLDGYPGASNTLKASKNKGVFISEYTTLINPIVINDSLSIKVKSVWLEKKWNYDDHSNAIPVDGYQMVLETRKKDLKGFTIDWGICISRYKCWRFCNNDAMMTDFERIPEDTITWEVQKGNHLDSSSKKEIIGEFKLVKKF